MANVSPTSNREMSAILDSADQSVYDVTTKADGPAGSLPLTDEMLSDWPSGDLFGLTQNAGMGWTAGRGRARAVFDPEHAGRPARSGRPADRAGLSHRALGNRHAGAGGRRGIETARRCPVRRHGLRPVRRPDPGDGRDDGQPALSQRRRHRFPAADPLACRGARGAWGSRPATRDCRR